MKLNSIRNRLVVSLVAALALITLAAGAGLYGFMESVLERELDTALSAKADAIIESIHLTDAGRMVMRNPAPLAHARRQGEYYFQVISLSGQVLMQSLPPEFPHIALPRPHKHRQFADAELPGDTDIRLTQRTFSVTAADEDDPPGAIEPTMNNLTLVVAHGRESLDYTLAMLLTGLALAAVALTVGMLLIVSVGIRRGLRPLDDISHLADRVGPQSLQLRFPSPDQLPLEIAPIAGKLNDLMDRLQEAFERERRFSAAVAHELRTPITELRSLCEVALRWPDQRAGQTDQQSPLAEALAISTEMSTLVESLLLLAKCQAGMAEPMLEEIDLHTAMEQWIAPLRDAATARGMTLRCTATAAVPADRQMFAIVLRNLLSNAIVYGHAGSEIIIETAHALNSPVIRIGNQTDDIGPDDLGHLVEPFWRKDVARTGSTHTGLGLSIVAAFAKTMKLELGFALPRPGWFEVELRWPVPAPGVITGG